MRGRIIVGVLLMAVASLTWAMAADSSLSSPTAQVRVTALSLSGGRIVAGIKRLGKTTLSEADLQKAMLVVQAGNQSASYPLAMIDPGASRLNSVKASVAFTTKLVLTKPTNVSAVIQGLDKQSPLHANLGPVATPKPTPAAVAQATPAAATTALKPVAASTPKPLAAATPKPVAAAAPKPLVAATPKPLSVAAPKPVSGAAPQAQATAAAPAVVVQIQSLGLAQGTVHVALIRRGAAKLDAKQLAEAELVVMADGRRHSYGLAKIDPGARGLNGPKAHMTFDTGITPRHPGQVRAELRGIGAVQIKTAALATATADTARKPLDAADAAQAELAVRQVLLHNGQVRVALARVGTAKLGGAQLKAIRLSVSYQGAGHYFTLGRMDPGAKVLNGPKAVLAFDTGIKPAKAVLVRAELEGQAKPSFAVAMLDPSPTTATAKPQAQTAPVKPLTVAAARISLAKPRVEAQQGRPVNLAVRGAKAANAAHVRVLLNGRGVKGMTASLSGDSLTIDTGATSHSSGQYELVFSDLGGREIQRLPLGLVFTARAAGEARAMAVDGGGGISMRLRSGGPSPFIQGWASQMIRGNLLSVSLSPPAGSLRVADDNTLIWTALPAGSYTIRVTVSGYWRIRGGEATVRIIGNENHDLEAVIEPMYRIYGTVLDNGRPIPSGVPYVTITRLDPPAGQSGTQLAVAIDAQGAYSAMMEAGRYGVCPYVAAASGLPQAIPHAVTLPHNNSQSARLCFDLSADAARLAQVAQVGQNGPGPQAPVTGVVRRADGSGIGNVRISFENVEPSHTATDQNGEFTSGSTDPMSLVGVTPSLPGWVFEPARAVVGPSGHAVFTGRPTEAARFTINGYVYGNSQPLPGVEVRCNDLTVSTSVDGGFAFRDLPAGTYRLSAHRLDMTFAPSAVEIRLSDRHSLNNSFVGTHVVPQGNMFISGHLWSDYYRTNGPGQLVSLYYCTGGNDPNCAARIPAYGNTTAETDAQSRYVFSGLGRGRYVVTPARQGQSAQTGISYQPPERIVNLGDNSVSGVNFVPINGDYAPLSASGRIVSADDDPIPSGTRIRVETCNRLNDPVCTACDAQVRLNADGSYMIWDITPGYTRITPMAANFQFTPPNVVLSIAPDRTDQVPDFSVRRVQGASTGGLVIRRVAYPGADVPQITWRVEYLGLADLTEYARQRPAAYQAQGRSSTVREDAGTGLAYLGDLPVGTYRVRPNDDTLARRFSFSEDTVYVFVTPGTSYCDFFISAR